MFFNNLAHAMGQAEGQGQGNAFSAFIPLILMFAIFYFLLIRPQQKKAKNHRIMLQNLKKGDRVLTNGGLYGRIVDMDGDVLTLSVSDNHKVRINRGYVAGLADPDKKTPETAQEKK
ncbi:MAG: preprotein translocase subunit YajC [Desulfonatronovibrionaceae bacterium]